MHIDGGILKLAAFRAGLGMGELAELAGVNRGTLSSIAHGKRCRTSTGEKIAAALGVPLAELVVEGRKLP